MIVIATVMLAPVACSLNFTHVKGGVLQLSEKTAFRQVAHADVYVMIDSVVEEGVRARTEELIDRTTERLRHLVQQFDGDSIFGELLMRRINSLWTPSKHSRTKRGLINLVGSLSSMLFGTATQEEVDKISRAVQALQATSRNLATLERKQLAAIDVLTENQQIIAGRLSDALTHIDRQDVLLQQLGRVLEEEARHLHHVEMRQRLTLLVANFADDVVAFKEMEAEVRLRRDLCESRRVTEAILPRDALEALLDNTANGARIPIDWYYTNLAVESMFLVNNTVICKLVIPYTHSETFRALKFRTLPVPAVNVSGFVKIYHDFNIAVSTTSDEVMFVTDSDCLGADPVICPEVPRFTLEQFPCIRGLLDNNLELQKQCPLLFMKAVDQADNLERLGLNLYAGYFESTEYYYRCTNTKPLYGRLEAGPYILALDADCTLDTGTFALSGVRNFRSHFKFEQVMPLIVKSDFIEEVPWQNVSVYLKEFPHVEEFKLSDLERVPVSSVGEQLIGVQLEPLNSSPWYKSWWFWGALVVLTVGGLYVASKLIPVLRSRWPRHPPGAQSEGLAGPPPEVPQPRASDPLYPSLSALQRLSETRSNENCI